jgi:hypothetical protein
MVLGGSPHHRRAADVDVLDGLVEGDPRARHRRLKRVQVHGNQVDLLQPLR